MAADRLVSDDLYGEVITRPSLAPIRLGGVLIPNRIVAAGPGLGAGLVFSRSFAVDPAGRRHPADPMIDAIGPVSAQSPIVLGVILTHAGRRGSTRPPEHGLDRPLLRDGWETIASSPIAYSPAHPAPRQMGDADFETLKVRYQEGAQNALFAGYEILMIDAADGGLLASFLSPLTNLRTDSWGGDIVGRTRVPVAVVEAVRSVWPGPLVVRMSASDWHPAGTRPADAVEAARILAEVGVDAIEVTAAD